MYITKNELVDFSWLLSATFELSFMYLCYKKKKGFFVFFINNVSTKNTFIGNEKNGIKI